MKIVRQGRDEPEADVDVDSSPGVVGIGRSGALRNVIHHVVHGEEEFEQLTPFGEVSSGGSHLKLDVGVDVDSENWMGVGRSGDLGGKSEGGELMGARDHGEGIGDPFEV
jgi:hypothetical protein